MYLSTKMTISLLHRARRVSSRYNVYLVCSVRFRFKEYFYGQDLGVLKYNRYLILI